MGRPLNKRYYGNTTGSGDQIRVKGWLSDSVSTEDLFVVKQLSQVRFLVADPLNPTTRQGVITLQAGTPTAPGQGRIEVYPYTALPTEYVRKLQRNVLITFDDNRYKYSVVNAATQIGECDIDKA